MKFDRFIVSKCQHTYFLMVLTDAGGTFIAAQQCICNPSRLPE